MNNITTTIPNTQIQDNTTSTYPKIITTNINTSNIYTPNLSFGNSTSPNTTYYRYYYF